VADQLLADWLASFPAAGQQAAAASAAKTTRRTYSMQFQRFLCFILTRQKRFESCTLDDIFEFLTAYSKVAPKFNSVASAATAIRWFLRISSKAELDKDPRWPTFLKGMKRVCEPPRKRFHVWNPRRVLDRIASAPKPTDLIVAGQEAAILILLATGSRLDDILKLSAKFEKTDFGVRLFFTAPRKTDLRKQFVSHLDIGFFPENRRICPARAVLRFLRIAHPLRKTGADRFFISSTGKPAAKQTVKRWILSKLEEVGISASVGSFRSASSSAAYLSGLSVDTIMKSAGWLREETWRQHYLRPIFEPNNLFKSYAPRN
jgi:integrase